MTIRERASYRRARARVAIGAAKQAQRLTAQALEFLNEAAGEGIAAQDEDDPDTVAIEGAVGDLTEPFTPSINKLRAALESVAPAADQLRADGERVLLSRVPPGEPHHARTWDWETPGDIAYA